MSVAMPAETDSPSELELLALVRSIHLHRKTGLVELETEGSEKHLYFVTGELYLLPSARSARKIAKLLKMQVWGDPASQQTLAGLYARIAARLSSWHTRSFRFVEGSRAPSRELVGPLPTARILMAAASAEHALEHLEQRLGAAGARIVSAVPAAWPAAAAVGPHETALLSALDEPRSLADLLTEVEETHPEALAALARLWAVGLIREESEPGEPVEASEAGVPKSEDEPTDPSGAATAAESRPGEDEISAIWRRHYGLQGDPFSLTPDPAYLFISEGHGEALAGLKLGLLERRGLLAMTGEVGTGKTTLLYALLSGLDPEIEAAYIYNTALSCDEILQSALTDLGVTYGGGGRLELLEALNDFLGRLAERGRTAALVIDEAQNLSDETFEQLRLLLNFETFDRKLLQIVLVGQPELARRLRAPQLRQIADRIAVRCHLEPLSKAEARRYVLHRLEAAGASAEIFSRRALSLVVRRTRGIPRRINIVCHNALLFAYAAGERRVGQAYVREALREARASVWETIRQRRGDQARDRLTGRGLVGRLPRVLRSGKASWLGAVLLAATAWLVLSATANRPERPGLRDSVVESAGEVREAAAEGGVRATLPMAPAGEKRVGAEQPEPEVVAAPGVPTAVPGRSIAATTANLRLRAGPGLDAPVLMVLPPGSRLGVLDRRPEWLQVIATDFDRTGWVSGRYVVGGEVLPSGTEQEGGSGHRS